MQNYCKLVPLQTHAQQHACAFDCVLFASAKAHIHTHTHTRSQSNLEHKHSQILDTLKETHTLYTRYHVPRSDFKANHERRRGYNRHYALKGRGRKESFRQNAKEDGARLMPKRPFCEKAKEGQAKVGRTGRMAYNARAFLAKRAVLES
eukprot:1139988-Pelagomonas_calceolata.AAC.3